MAEYLDRQADPGLETDAGKGREGGPVRRMQAACFQFEEREDEL